MTPPSGDDPTGAPVEVDAEKVDAEKVDAEKVDAKKVDAVVVGSGFGGAVTAARLAQAGLSVVVLERGRRWPAGSFPRGDDLKRDWLWASGRGLFDVRWLDRMLSVQAAGWGGGSLVYANVIARPPAEVFDHPEWPRELTRAVLDPYYDLVAHMLEVQPVGPDPATGQTPARTRLIEQGVARSGWRHASVRPNLAVRFGDPDVLSPNRHGALQAGCSFVGDCVVGCDQRAKTTLDLTYLHVAERAGAVARTDTEVVDVSPYDAGYRVVALDHATGTRVRYDAPTVFLGAGAVGTTELLLRLRASGSLPRVSATLGSRFSGNGDYLSFVRRPGAAQLVRGPTITSSSLVETRFRGDRVWFQIQDGNLPTTLGAVMAAANPAPGLTAIVTGAVGAMRRFLGRPKPAAESMTLLLMGRDSANGRLVLDHQGEAAVTWVNRDNVGLYGAEGRLARRIGREIGARVLPLPTWSVLRRAVTVHNLGGAPMGADVEDGVVDEHGEVFGHPGLYVVDGSALPGSTGVNPSATIAAVAERRVEHHLRRRLGDPTWAAPETVDVVPGDVPEDRAATAMNAQVGTEAADELRFAEQMTGPTATLTLRVRIDSVAAFCADPQHRARLDGTVDLAGRATAAVADGTLSLFPDDNDESMRYELDLVGDDGSPIHLVGVKHQHVGQPWRTWHDLTTLALSGAGLEPGTVRMGVGGVARLIGSIGGHGDRRPDRLAAVLRFVAFFVRGTLRRLVGRQGRVGA